MMRKCSHCGNNGHNLRTCPNRGGVKIFGVRLDGGGSSTFRKCSSMVNLSHHGGRGSVVGDEREKDGYASEGFAAKGSRERKKGVAWTEEEHKMFLLGLRKLGKGDWRGIARNFVVSRTSTQVASHAQKYFIRQMNAHKRKKRTSLFDMMPNELEAQSSNPAAAPLPPLEAEHESTSSNSNTTVPSPSPGEVERAISKPGIMQLPYVVVPCSPFFPFSYPIWGCYRADVMANSMRSVVKPTAVHSAVPINVGDVPGFSKLSLGGEPAGQMSFGSSERISAFHRNNPSNGSGSSSSPIQAA